MVTALWRDRDADTLLLSELTDRAVQAALTDPGPALSVLATPYDSPTSTPATRLAERLSCLRFHRADAHTAAWEAAGLTVDEIKQLAPGPARTQIEDDTNLRAAAPYAVLAPSERHTLIAGLSALRG